MAWQAISDKSQLKIFHDFMESTIDTKTMFYIYQHDSTLSLSKVFK